MASAHWSSAMSNDLSPEGINREHGRAVWRCWGCKTDTCLHWLNGWSVAVCPNTECSSAYMQMVQAQEAEREEFEIYCRENA